MPDPAWKTDEPSGALWLEQSVFAAGHLGAIAYGMHIIVFFRCVYFIVRVKRPQWHYLIYVTLLFLCATVNLACNVNFNEHMWLDERNYPGGPLAFMLEQQPRVVDTVANSVTSLSGFLADALLIYRCFVIWGRRWWIVVIPIAALIASTVLTILTVIQAAQPFSSLWASQAFRFALPYWSLLVSLNISVTLLMITRLLWTRHRVRKLLGNEHSQPYTSIIAMIIECALPYAVVSFIYVILYGTQNTAQNLFLPLFAQVQCIAPELIIMRVSRGRAWDSNTAERLTQTATPSMVAAKMPRFAKFPGRHPSSSLGMTTTAESMSKPGTPTLDIHPNSRDDVGMVLFKEYGDTQSVESKRGPGDFV